MALLLCVILVLAGGCHAAPGQLVRSQLRPPVPQVHIAGFAVGRTVVIERKVVLGNPVSVVPGVWSVVGAITLPAGGYYLLTLQIRMPRGSWAEGRMVRVGWGEDADGRDETGYHTFVPRPDGLASSDSFTHALAGGGPLAFEVNLHARLRAGRAGPLAAVQLHTIVCKAHRVN
ncbi:MAG TPA: hypothetical protein VF143_00710 [Candidatus Nanopelagicales bacterium]